MMIVSEFPPWVCVGRWSEPTSRMLIGPSIDLPVTGFAGAAAVPSRFSWVKLCPIWYTPTLTRAIEPRPNSITTTPKPTMSFAHSGLRRRLAFATGFAGPRPGFLGPPIPAVGGEPPTRARPVGTEAVRRAAPPFPASAAASAAEIAAGAGTAPAVAAVSGLGMVPALAAAAAHCRQRRSPVGRRAWRATPNRPSVAPVGLRRDGCPATRPVGTN